MAVTSAATGLLWDVSWHSSIGRDTFWTPAHMAVYLCGVLAGLTSGYLILLATFGAQTSSGVEVMGFRGPLGAFIAAWGSIAMLTAGAFDDWWHAAYGLDVRIISPPHILLLGGILTIAVGSLLLTLSAMNQAPGSSRRLLEAMFLYLGGLIVILLMILSLEYLDRPLLHSSRPYRLMAALLPVVLTAVWRASGYRFAATLVIATYSILVIGMILLLPSFPAQPKLGPVFQNVTHFVPPQFPLLLIAPALVLDLFWQMSRKWKRWAIAAVSGPIFVAVLVAAEWPFANFLMTSGARNAFFGAGYLGYFVLPGSYLATNTFDDLDTGALFLKHMAWAVVAAIVSTRIGLSCGDWMRKVRR